MYVPVLRGRSGEVSALKELSGKNVFSEDSIVPLFEIVQQNYTGRVSIKNPKSFTQIYTDLFESLNTKIMIDIPLYVNLSYSKIGENFKEFLQPLISDDSARLSKYQQLSNVKNIIPIISYCPNLPYLGNLILNQNNVLRNFFSTVAFRIFSNCNNEILNEISKIIKKDEFLILDINTMYYNDNNLSTLFNKLFELKNKTKCRVILLNTPIPNSFTNTMIKHKIPADIDNSLLQNYQLKKFDGFGDYAGIKKDNLEKGGLGVIATLFYSKFSNKYIGYTANPSTDVYDYAKIIAPSILNSYDYNKYGTSHAENCPGCLRINEISEDHPGSRATWKTISIEHYIISVSELLRS